MSVETKAVLRQCFDDPLFSQETYKMDSYYDVEMQADLRERLANIDAGKNLVDFDPTLKAPERLEVAAT